jgi:hypothetical protein
MNLDTHNSHSDLVMDWANCFLCFEKRQMQLAIHGVAPKRQRRMEIDLHRLTKRNLLIARYYGKKLLYTRPRNKRLFDEFDGSKIYHAHACTECLLRFYLSNKSGEIVPEKLFRGSGSVPDGGIRYPNGTLLTFEFSTRHNFFFSRNMEGKLDAYDRNLQIIESNFDAKAIVVFVIDVPRDTVKRFVRRLDTTSSWYFIDNATFLSIPIGDALTTPAYFWTDGKEYPLKNV